MKINMRRDHVIFHFENYMIDNTAGGVFLIEMEYFN